MTIGMHIYEPSCEVEVIQELANVDRNCDSQLLGYQLELFRCCDGNANVQLCIQDVGAIGEWNQELAVAERMTQQHIQAARNRHARLCAASPQCRLYCGREPKGDDTTCYARFPRSGRPQDRPVTPACLPAHMTHLPFFGALICRFSNSIEREPL